MKTDDLVAMLAAGAAPVEPRATARRYGAALGWGAFGSTLLMALLLGVRPDLTEAARLPMFWLKLVFPLGIAGAALLAAMRLSRPGVGLGAVPGGLAALVLVIWLLALGEYIDAAPSERGDLVYGQSWLVCPAYIVMLSIPVLAAALWAMRGLAPTRPVLAGAAAGLLAGSFGAAVYALYCDEMGAPFLAIWYVLGMLLSAGCGAAAGRAVLRW